MPVPPLEPGTALVRRLHDRGASHDQLIDRLRAAALAHPLDGADGVPGPHFPLSQPTGLPAAVGWPSGPAGVTPFAGSERAAWHVNGDGVGER